MIGVILAAGQGSRLGALTADLPKSLLSVQGDISILESIAANMRAVGMTDAVVIAGYRADVVRAEVPELQRRTGLRLRVLHNERWASANNAYSLWLAREYFSEGVLLCNGDTFHPVSVPERLLAAPSMPLLLAVDEHKALGEEEMKIIYGSDGRLQRINKSVPVASADGEYIGVSLISPDAAPLLATTLAATWRGDPSLYYEDGYQEFVHRGGSIGTVGIGRVPWVEVDTPEDLARARDIADSVLGSPAGTPRAAESA